MNTITRRSRSPRPGSTVGGNVNRQGTHWRPSYTDDGGVHPGAPEPEPQPPEAPSGEGKGNGWTEIKAPYGVVWLAQG